MLAAALLRRHARGFLGRRAAGLLLLHLEERRRAAWERARAADGEALLGQLRREGERERGALLQRLQTHAGRLQVGVAVVVAVLVWQW